MATHLSAPMRVCLGTHVELFHVPPSLWSAVTALATFSNPEYAKRVKLGRSTWNVSPELIAWHGTARHLTLPRGLWPALQDLLGPVAALDDQRQTADSVDFGWRGQLWPEQQQAAQQCLQHDDSILVGPPGSGKTNMALAYVAARRQPALFLVPTRDLAYQALDRARALFTLPDTAFGLIGDGQTRLGTHLTVGIIQTLIRRDLTAWAPAFGTVVVDEAHHAPASTFSTVIQAFPARYRLGATATPDRADGLGSLMQAVLGPIVAHLTVSRLTQVQRLIIPHVRQIATAFAYPYTEDYALLMEAVTTNTTRNTLILRKLWQEVQQNRRILVLCERVAHAQDLYTRFHDAVPAHPAAVLTGSTKKSQRTAILNDLRAETLTLVFASKIADEGLDVPVLDCLALVTGGRSVSRVAQQVGRIMRPAPGKTDAVVLDFCDWDAPVLAAQAKARFWQVYKKLGLSVKREDGTTVQGVR